MEQKNKKRAAPQDGTSRSGFSGKLGYVLAVAGSAVGLGNIWRFPYLAAKYGGGIFLLTYLALMLTFGYALIVSETALGRMTKRSPVGAFGAFGKSAPFRIGGWLNAVIPMLIVPYYSVIGGWVVKYLFEYLRGSTSALAEDGYFPGFIADSAQAEIWFLLFGLMVAAVLFGGVKQGVERVAKVMMPLLVVLAVFVACYSVTRPGALEGVKYFLIPNFANFSWMTVVAAMGQMFYSLSIAMGILYTYGSYIKKDVDIERSTTQVEIFDTAIAMLAGLMIIPAVFAFSGGDRSALNAGPGLMFMTLPKVFASMKFGGVIGTIFFMLVFFAALTSAISLMETIVSVFMDKFGWKRQFTGIFVFILAAVMGIPSSLGFGTLDFISWNNMTILDIMDFISNSVLMPIVAFFTCIFVGFIIRPKSIADEVKETDGTFRAEGMFNVMIKWIAPIFLVIILASSVASGLGWIKI